MMVFPDAGSSEVGDREGEMREGRGAAWRVLKI
jgi:hypothetical protein